ncbi:MAG TPA: acyl-CoA dehydrogenase, partial [Rhodobacteraceae bacterium]|nr:acyl-CoA dehydrogenase [Paracoccaceae bacterium]
AAGSKAFGTTALKVDGGWLINGKKIFASLSGHANYYGALCTEISSKDEDPDRANTMYIAVPANSDG